MHFSNTSKFKELLPSICPLCQLQHFFQFLGCPQLLKIWQSSAFFFFLWCPSHPLSLITVMFSFQESHLNIGVETVCEAISNER